MLTSDSIDPGSIAAKNTTNAKGAVFAAAAFHYTEGSSARDRTPASASSYSRPRGPTTNMSSSATTAAPVGMYVRALYDYDADDRTSLSFRQGDTIQVITQLSSGWWDGIINGLRGWFPSNYCVVISAPDDPNARHGQPQAQPGEPESIPEEEYESYDDDPDTTVRTHDLTMSPEDDQSNEPEFPAYWIPQATPGGRLFYFNTMTGCTTMELPLETPTSVNEQGPRDRMNVHVPDQTRAPPQEMVAGYEEVEDPGDELTSESDADSLARGKKHTRTRRRRSDISDGASPTTSMESLDTSPIAHLRKEPSDPDGALNGTHPASGLASTSFTSSSVGQPPITTIPQSYFDDGSLAPVTWNKIIHNMRRSIELYGRAINNADRAEYVRRAEDISDHLRMLLAAASGTTDNHSGNPSIISTNKALYPHFRDMMSRFSKLVVSSHIASADYPTPDSIAKCLQEADGVLHGVHSFIEVARTQRGEEIPRLSPGFVMGQKTGGNWQNNNLDAHAPIMTSSFMDGDDNDLLEPHTPLDDALLKDIEDQKSSILLCLRQLEQHLLISEKKVSVARHRQIGDAVCTTASKIIDRYRLWMSTIESVDLSGLRSAPPGPRVFEFTSQKQRLYDLIMELVIVCQAVAGPLGDEWAETRGDPLGDRLNEVRVSIRQLETCISQIAYSLQHLMELAPQESHPKLPRELTVQENLPHPGEPYQHSSLPNQSKQLQRPRLGEMEHPRSFTDGVGLPEDVYHHRQKDNLKAFRVIGELPPSMLRESEETPRFLQLDHEGELSFDAKHTPPQLRGGTLTALVEQLTRHDKLDSGFNNTFLLTYRSFTTAQELFEQLVRRFSVQPPAGITEDEYKVWVDRKQKLIRLRVVNILKSWFDNYWMESHDAAANQILRRVYSFAKDALATTNTPGSVPLMNSIDLRIRGQEPKKKLLPMPNSAAPTPILPKNMRKLKFLDIDSTEFARQLTVIEAKLYGKVKPTECLNKTWQKKVGPGECEPAPNVKAVILHSNRLTNWVAEMILTQSDVKKRVVVIKHFVSIADKCRALNNFSTLTSIISALGTAPIHRLQRTWTQVNQRTMTALESLRKLMGSTKNFGEYRDTLHQANPPCIPFFGPSGPRPVPVVIADPRRRRVPDRSHLHRGRHPVDHQADRLYQLHQTRQDGRGHPRHTAVPERSVRPPRSARPPGVHPQQHASRGRCPRDVRKESSRGASRAGG